MPEQEDSLDRIADAFEKVADELNSILDRIEAHTEAMHNLSRSVWEIASAIRGEPRAE